MVLDHETEQDIKKILVAWYGPKAANWPINDEVLKAVAEVLEASGECSTLFRYVPKSPNPVSAMKSVTGSALVYVKDIVKRAASDKQLYYATCVRQKGIERESDVHRAAFGY
ncbi:hypothetical protein MTZ49_06425 [Entomomonas sp. E2T0]|uniref:hypothetical protein n=1 Tax=Entomomonas sp. E2T0 TaxID=2930213 RepID=UPI002228181B|nr:hypothetical protein [Entomomonas sp. E2T0]UYZ85184.1 hypothetical protein MTZ49_06425 [Entomomonas sp. E2T0]